MIFKKNNSIDLENEYKPWLKKKAKLELPSIKMKSTYVLN